MYRPPTTRSAAWKVAKATARAATRRSRRSTVCGNMGMLMAMAPFGSGPIPVGSRAMPKHERTSGGIGCVLAASGRSTAVDQGSPPSFGLAIHDVDRSSRLATRASPTQSVPSQSPHARGNHAPHRRPDRRSVARLAATLLRCHPEPFVSYQPCFPPRSSHCRHAPRLPRRPFRRRHPRRPRKFAASTRRTSNPRISASGSSATARCAMARRT